MSAIASVLMFLDFALPIFPPFMKMDISNVPALISSFAIGPWSGVLVELIKNAVNVTHTSTGGIGEMASFTIGAAYVVPAGLIYRRRKTIRGALLSLAAGIFATSLAAVLANYFVLIPLYSRIIPIDTLIGMYQAVNPYAATMPKIVLTTVLPFNLLKASIAALLTFPLYKRLSPVIRGL
jgi:riboflavin transporter FmnP